MYNKGDIVLVYDKIDPTIVTGGTVRYVEPIMDFGVNLLYIRSNNENDNTLFDDRFGDYWCEIEDISDYVVKVR